MTITSSANFFAQGSSIIQKLSIILITIRTNYAKACQDLHPVSR